MKEWMTELRKQVDVIENSEIRSFYQGLVDDENSEAWQGYFDDGYTPSEALAEDMTYLD